MVNSCQNQNGGDRLVQPDDSCGGHDSQHSLRMLTAELDSARRRIGALEAEIHCLRSAAGGDSATETTRACRLLESSSEAVYELDASGCCTFVNSAGAAMLGYTREEVMGRNMHELVHSRRADGSTYSRNECPIVRCIETGVGCRVDHEVFWRRNGTPVPVEYTANPVSNGGRISGAVVTFRDITVRRNLEAELALREQRLNAFFTCATAGLVLMDRDLRFVQVNQTLAEINGVPASAHISRTVEEVLPELAPVVVPKLREVLVTGRPMVKVEIAGETPREPGVHRHWMESMFPVFDNSGAPQGVGAVVVEITELKRAEEALRISEERLRQLADNINGVFWITDTRQARILYVSPGYESIWGRSCASLYEDRDSWLEGIHPDDRERVRQRNQAGDYSEIYRVVRPDGSIRWIHDRAFPVRDERGVYRVVGLAQDITDQKQLEAQYREAQKMESVGQLAGGIAHDFNNLLTVIQGHAGMLLFDEAINAGARESIAEISLAAERAARLTRQLLTFSRRQVVHREQLQINTVVEDLRKMLSRVVGEIIEVAFHARPVPLISADAGMVDQIVMNLTVNARDAMPKGGRLILRTGLLRADERIPSRPQDAAGDFVWLSVSDTGCGIPAENLPHIFEPFFTTKEVGKGTGLGLATVYAIAQQHGGWVAVDSTIGKGTTFTIYFPATKGSGVGASTARQQMVIPGGRETILLVEDDGSLRHLARTCLQARGYQVVEADSGPAALEQWALHRHSVDLLLTDMVMPGGITGRDLAEAVTSEKPGLKVAFMSGYSPELAGLEQLLASSVNFLQKPFTPHTLAQHVRQWLDN